ncbi:hypothetical protein niasHS_017403 [Heterodera schachtii]|uniref:Uncharacterized protein n=1 Tax=Heterodera schachtii TaxID=97005 RepID=A0ABD2HXF0_HETSC
MPQSAHFNRRRCRPFLLFSRSFRRFRPRHSPARLFVQRKRIIHFGLLFLLLSQTNGQFGEIASVISSLVASGAPAGLAGLGTAGSLGSLGASAGSGAASALSNIGPLYQLAQAALQLTGTGVGIANQASESAWFPVVVENAAKMSRDFQDRLVQGGLGGAGGGHETGTAKSAIKERSGSKNGGEFGTDYGKEFGSEEKGTFGRGVGGIGSVDTSLANLFGTRVSMLPLLPGFGTTLATLLPEATKRPLLPGEGALLPGESPLGEFGESENGGGHGETQKLIGIGTVEEVPLSPLSTESEQKHEFGIDHSETPLPSPNGRLLPGEVASAKENTAKRINSSTSGRKEEGNHLSISSPKITVKLPDYDEEKDGGKSKERGETGAKKTGRGEDKIKTEFNEDNDGGGRTTDEESRLEPLIPSEGFSVQRLRQLNMTQIELGNDGKDEDEGEDGEGNEVPKLQKLISQLKTSNLSELDLEELQKQLAENEEPGEPRENTEPTTTTALSKEDETTVTGNGAETEQQGKTGSKGKGSKRIRPPNPKREEASNRNLEAFRKGSERETDERDGEGAEKAEKGESEGVELVDGQRDPILRKIVDFQHPPVILSLERPHPNPAEGLTPFFLHANEKNEKRKNKRIEGRGTDSGEEKAKDEQKQRQRSSEAIPTRALGVRSEKVDERVAAEDGVIGSGEWGTEERRRTRTKSSGRITGDGGKTTTKSTITKNFNSRRPQQKRQPLAITKKETTTETEQMEEDNELPIVDSMVEKSEMEQQQQPFPRQTAVSAAPWQFPSPHSVPNAQNSHFPWIQQQMAQFNQQNNQLQREEQPKANWQQNNWQGQQQWASTHNQQNHNTQQQTPQQNQQRYHHNYQQQQYPQQQPYPGQLQYHQQQQQQQRYHQQQQYQQLPYKEQLNQQQKPNLNPSNPLNNNYQPYSYNQQQNNNFHSGPSQFVQPQKELGVRNGPFPQNGANSFRGRQFGQRQRAVKQPIDHSRQNVQKMANGRKIKVPPKAPPAFPPRRIPSAAKGNTEGKTPRTFPPRTIAPPTYQTTTNPTEVQYPFSSGTLLTLAQPAQFQTQTKHIARK